MKREITALLTIYCGQRHMPLIANISEDRKNQLLLFAVLKYLTGIELIREVIYMSTLLKVK